MACSDFDGQVVRSDDEVAVLAKEFVCVRIQSMNGIDVRRFQFEYDLTWMSFFLNADLECYLRYGGRDDSGPESHLNQASLVLAMKRSLALHEAGQARPGSDFEPSGKAEGKPSFPEQNPAIVRLVAKRESQCIHCHEVKSASLQLARQAGRLEKEMVFTYPAPNTIGMELDSVFQSKVKSILPGSPAAKAGLGVNDVLTAIDGAPVETFGDATRALHLARSKSPKIRSVELAWNRKGKAMTGAVELPERWYSSADPSWRASKHVVGPSSGFWAVPISAGQRKSLGIKDGKLGLKVNVVWGQWAKQAGVKNGDIVVGVDGKSEAMSIKQLQSYLQMNKSFGDTAIIKVLRNRKALELEFHLPGEPDH